MLDTPQVHALLGLLGNYEKQNNTGADVTILSHHELYKTIIETHDDLSRKSFDVVMYDIPWLSSLASAHILADITDDVADDIDPDIFLPNCFRFFSEFNHRYYGLPFMYAPQIFYYRKDLFENTDLMMEYFRHNNIRLRPPRTLKEFNTIADFFTNHTNAINYGISIPAAYDECLAPEIYMRLHAFGGHLFDHQGNVSMNQNVALKAYINFLRSARLAKPDFRTCTDVTTVQDFLLGETAMLISYPSFLADVADLRRSSQIGAIGYDHVPGRSSILGGWSLGISNRSVQKRDAFSFLKWLCDEHISTYFTLLGGQTAISSTYTNDEIIKLYPWFPLYHSTYQYSKPTLPPYLGDHAIISQNDIDATICKWVYKLLDEEIEVSDAIAATTEELNQLVSESKVKR
ncbi:MAG: extracellular solute-binding protein [Lentisphaerae bacterium]|nr:extracellular solute-binding protein [Lentisphaerota bacterium]